MEIGITNPLCYQTSVLPNFHIMKPLCYQTPMLPKPLVTKLPYTKPFFYITCDKRFYYKVSQVVRKASLDNLI